MYNPNRTKIVRTLLSINTVYVLTYRLYILIQPFIP